MDLDTYSILTTYFKDHHYPFTKHHIDSYREFLRRHIPETIASFNPITMVKLDDDNPDKLKVKIELFVGGDQTPLKVYVDRPTFINASGDTVLLTPHEARMKNASYMAHIFADVTVRYTEDGKPPHDKQFNKVLIGTIPIMLHSDICILHEQGPQVLRELGECIYDQGGYFIIDGKEKVIVSQERIATNRLFIEDTPKESNFSHRAHIHCTGESGETALSPRTITFYMIRKDLPLFEDDDDIKKDYRKHRGAILATMPSIPGTMPLFQLFRLLGVESDQDILETIFGTSVDLIPSALLDIVYPSIRHCADRNIYDQVTALEGIAPRTYFKSVQQVHAVLVNDLFPNMNEHRNDDTSGLYESKAKILGQMVYDLVLSVAGVRALSDRDGYVFKRIDISGVLIAQLFQSAYIQFKNTCRDMLDSHYHYVIKNKGAIDRLITNENVRRFLQPAIITDIMMRSLKGRWGPKPENPDQEVVQDLSRISYIGFLSHLRRVNLPLDRTIKITSPHRLHSQQWGIMCPFESPDGASVGYLKNFALLSHVTFGTDSNNLTECFSDLGVLPLDQIDSKDLHRFTAIYLNGQWMGGHTDPATFVRTLRLYRRNALINIFTSISWEIKTNIVRVMSEAGRPCRPLLIVENKSLVFTTANKEGGNQWFDWIFGKKWKDFHTDFKTRPQDLYYQSFYHSPAKVMPSLRTSSASDIVKVLEASQASIEFLDIEEENTRLISMKPEEVKGLTTHCEISPSTIFSVVTNNIPFANHNQAPRNIFHGSQSKQAIGVFTTNFSKRFDTMGYIQHYPQRPLVTTRNAHYTMSDRMPNGFNVIVAVMSYTGFNQEDGVMINKSAIDRGLFNITAYKSMTVSERKISEDEEVVLANPVALQERLKRQNEDDTPSTSANPPTTKNLSASKIGNFHPEKTDYSLLGEDGVIKKESYIQSGQSVAIVGLVKRTKRYVKDKQGVLLETKVVEEYQNMSMHSDVHHYGKVDAVYVEKMSPLVPFRVCKVRFRKVRKPELGDKHSSRHGQKGVIGMIIKGEDMPYTKDGIVPDIIINPHAFPSRMTIGHMVECIFAKLCCMEGTLGDGSVFLPFDLKNVCDNLETRGFEKYGNELLYNGFTGQQIPTDIFIGPTFYLRLKHMVADKVHSRGVGFNNPHDQLTRQPTAGRSNQGGLRIGEMERDSLLSHGVAQFIKESMMERSDKYQWIVCKRCGVLVEYSKPTRYVACRSCGHNDISIIETPYSMMLLTQELESMGIQMRFSDEPFDLNDEDLIEEEEEDEKEAQAGGTNIDTLDEGEGEVREVNEEGKDGNGEDVGEVHKVDDEGEEDDEGEDGYNEVVANVRDGEAEDGNGENLEDEFWEEGEGNEDGEDEQGHVEGRDGSEESEGRKAVVIDDASGEATEGGAPENTVKIIELG